MSFVESVQCSHKKNFIFTYFLIVLSSKVFRIDGHSNLDFFLDDKVPENMEILKCLQTGDYKRDVKIEEHSIKAKLLHYQCDKCISEIGHLT